MVSVEFADGEKFDELVLKITGVRIFLTFFLFFSLRGFPFSSFVFHVLPFFSRDLRGSVGINNPCFL